MHISETTKALKGWHTIQRLLALEMKFKKKKKKVLALALTFLFCVVPLLSRIGENLG